MMNSVHNVYHLTDMTGDMAFLCPDSPFHIVSAELSHKLFFSNCPVKGNHKPKYRANERADKCRCFWESLKGEGTVDRRTQVHVFTEWRLQLSLQDMICGLQRN